MANELVANLSLNPNSISDLTGVNVAEGCQRNLVNNAQRQAMSMVKANFAANAGTITTSSILTLASISTGDYILLTPSGGSTSMSSFGTATEGLSKRLRALGTVILRNDTSKLNLPSGADLTISTGDEIYARAQGGTVWNVTHEPYSGIANAIVNASSVTASETTSLLILSGGSVQKANASAISFASGRTYRALSAAHTISAGDNNAILDFTTAGVTCAFVPLASLSDGFTVTVMNTAGSGDVTLNPDAAETLDGFATRLLRPGNRSEIVKATSGFKTMRGVYSYTSADVSYSLSANIDFTHSLGEVPQTVEVGLVNSTADLGYSVGEVYDLSLNFSVPGAANQVMGMLKDATTVTMLTGVTAIGITNKATKTTSSVTPASWRFRVNAYVRYG